MKKNRVLEGVVISDKMDKTVTVQVVRRSIHKLYRKSSLVRKKYKVHDKDNEAKIGDKAKITECRPYSKEKSFRLLEIIK
ncbi:MAG: 30S ribosomal protein S17 [Candidatus Omnitrophota bacterium]